MTVSLGAVRPMTFYSRFNGSSPVISTEPLTHGSIISFTKHSQVFWKHEIPTDLSIATSRISLTFRNIAPFFKNSTIVLGDSNTKHFRFGMSTSENPTFGKWLPGKRVSAMKVMNIPSAEHVVPYNNVIIHTGINDLRCENPPTPIQLVWHLESRCAQIHHLSPNTQIVISPLLPTKDANINEQVYWYNSLLHQLCDKHPRLKLISYCSSLFADNRGILMSDMGRYDRKNNCPLESDSVHLGAKGLRLFRYYIKASIIPPRFRFRTGMNVSNTMAASPVHNTSAKG